MSSSTPLLLAAGSVLDLEPVEVIEHAAAAGFSGIGLRLSAPYRQQRSVLETWRQRAEECGVEVHDVEVHRIGSDDGRQWATLLDDAVAVGAGRVLVVSDLADLDATTAAVGRLVDLAAVRHLEVALEYMAWTTPATPAGALEVARRTGALVIADLLHHHRVGAGAAELIALADSGRLGWVQLCDAPLGPPEGPLVEEARHRRLPPGEGGLPLDDLLAAVPVATPISVEVQSDRLADELDAADRIAHLAATAEAALGRIDRSVSRRG